MKTRTAVIISLSSMVTLMAVVVVLLVAVIRYVPKDAQGEYPQEIVEKFLVAARQKDYDLAKQYWGGVSSVRRLLPDYDDIARDERFRELCDDNASFSNFRYRGTRRGKGEYYIVQFNEMDGRKVVDSRSFYMFIAPEDGTWKLHRGMVW